MPGVPARRSALRIVRWRSRWNGSPYSYGLVSYVRSCPCPSGSTSCWPIWSLVRLVNSSRSALPADRPQSLGVSSSRPSVCSIRPASVEHLGELGEAFERARGVVAEQVTDLVHVGLGERAGAGGAAQQVLELVEVAELRHGLHRLAEAQRVVAAEVVRRSQPICGISCRRFAPELVDLPAQVHVLEQLVGELLELRPLLGRHRVEHRLHRRHAPGHLLEQLVDVLRVLREEVAVLRHELVEVGLPRSRW